MARHRNLMMVRSDVKSRNQAFYKGFEDINNFCIIFSEINNFSNITLSTAQEASEMSISSRSSSFRSHNVNLENSILQRLLCEFMHSTKMFNLSIIASNT